MIKLYKKAKYWDEIEDIMRNDYEWATMLWEVWFFDAFDDLTYWHYRTVFIDNWKVVWFISCWKVDCNSNNAYVNQLYVVKDYRGKWKPNTTQPWIIGKQLLDDAILYYQRIWIDVIKIKVYSINKHAIEFYKRNWFIQCGEHERSEKINWKYVNCLWFERQI